MTILTKEQKIKDILYICNSYNIMEYNLLNNNFNNKMELHHIYIGILKNKPFIGMFLNLPKEFKPIIKISTGDFQIVYNEYIEFLKFYKQYI